MRFFCGGMMAMLGATAGKILAFLIIIFGIALIMGICSVIG